MFRQRILFVLLPVLGAVLALAFLSGAGHLWAGPLASGNIPELMNYQGYLSDSGGNPISGTKTFTFTIYDASSGGNSVWAETHSGVAVSEGFFNVLLGSAGTPLTSSVFNGDTRYLEAEVDGTTLPRQRLASVPYALQAYRAEHAVDAMTAITATYTLNAGSADYANVVVVAQSGGDYTTLTDAMNSISPTSGSRYLILVMPGVYNERVVVKPYVHIRGAGPYVTRITAQVENGNINSEDAATVILPANSQLSDLSIANTGATQNSSALHIDNGNDSTELHNLRIFANTSGGDRHVAVYMSGGTANLIQVYAEAAGATIGDWAVFTNASSPWIDSSTLLADGSGGSSANGLRLNGGGPTVQNSTISGDNASVAYGIEATSGTATVRVDHSSVTGEDFGVRLSAGNYTVYIGASQLVGGANAFSGTFKCAQSYDETYTELSPTCL